ncbi:hypothetical protein NL676_029879 [Syzygium grande]|nr:hypothetical protein NL676_029879 [Syzygium grande]
MSTELRQQAGMLASWARYYAVGGSLKQILRSQGNQKWLPHRVWKVRTGNELGKRPAGIETGQHHLELLKSMSEFNFQ